jgi:hypothetical protein
MMKSLSILAALLALAPAPVLAQPGYFPPDETDPVGFRHGGQWRCVAVGTRDDPRAPAPQRLPFERTRADRFTAQSAALSACRHAQDPPTIPSSCRIDHCTHGY